MKDVNKSDSWVIRLFKILYYIRNYSKQENFSRFSFQSIFSKGYCVTKCKYGNPSLASVNNKKMLYSL